MNEINNLKFQEAKDVTSTKLWRRISIIQNGRRSNGEHDIVNIKLRKVSKKNILKKM